MQDTHGLQKQLRKVSIAAGQAGSVGDELGARDRRHAPPVISWGHLGHGHKMGKIAGTARSGSWTSGQYQGVRSELATRIRVGLTYTSKNWLEQG